MEKILENLKKNNMQPYFVQTKQEAMELLKTLIQPGQTVSCGGSVTLDQLGVLPFLRNGAYTFLDRYAPGLTQEETADLFRKVFFADVYLASANAITEAGEIYNVDGNGNRVAAILFGPKSVILIVGKNKIVPDLKAAAQRVKAIAAPLNCKRLGCKTYCAETGSCISLQNPDAQMAAGCASDTRICCAYTVLSHQRIKNRIKVIIVNEDLGY